MLIPKKLKIKMSSYFFFINVVQSQAFIIMTVIEIGIQT